MPSNKPYKNARERIQAEKFVDNFNTARDTSSQHLNTIKAYENSFRHDASQSVAEERLTGAVNELEQKITPMKGVVDQQAGIMQIVPAMAKLLTTESKKLAEKNPEKPMKILDIGMFCGRSAGAMAKGMHPDVGGQVITCDIPGKYTDINLPLAQKYWEEEGVARYIKPVIAPASETLQKLIDNGEAGTFDMVFIDADKPGYSDYYEKALQLLRPGGKIILDNMLWSGNAANPKNKEPATIALRTLAQRIVRDPRIQPPIMLKEEDGPIIVEKRDPHSVHQLRSRMKVEFPDRGR